MEKISAFPAKLVLLRILELQENLEIFEDGFNENYLIQRP